MAAFVFVNDECKNGPFFGPVGAVWCVDELVNAGQGILEVSRTADNRNSNSSSHESDLCGVDTFVLLMRSEKADEDHVARVIDADNEAKASAKNVEDHTMMG